MSDLRNELRDLGLNLVQEKVGKGGSATVHRCEIVTERDGLPPLGTQVAVKEYHPWLLAEPGQVERARQEAVFGARLAHPNVVQTYGLLPSGENPKFLVMEWIEGETLAAWNTANGDSAPWERLFAIAQDVLEGTAYFHGEKAKHRDIKPENVMLRANGSAVLMDVGVAETSGTSESTLHTSMATFLGSTRYASPQYLEGLAFEFADDIYALGGTFYELFTGQRMFEMLERKPALAAVIIREGQRVERLRPSVPESLRVLLRAMLSRDRQMRPNHAQIREALTNPAGSEYLRLTAATQATQDIGFRIIDVRDNSNSIIVDLDGRHARIGSRHTIVRRSLIYVPSTGREEPCEEWIGVAEMKHTHGAIGHLLVQNRRWQAGERSRTGMMSMFGTAGEWVEHERPPKPKDGDWVLPED